ncbi:MAG: SpoIVB peptidase S55 domain protein [Anaerovibrio sp.]|uniref:SpoIVB peptidase S55 domain-containing protein n=1 Tax=Anaerovibrio sp. TaxID=1872532 RepID=UPI0025F77089|nr:SpoIVB peptidase S55 domain-containing protein [Anaerovibrio sp.]MCR5176205.1 SpoIVB peptidase S55 domain protein [Anaerovibrio sp.]
MRKFLYRLKLKKNVLALCTTFAVAAVTVCYAAMPETINIDDVTPGMTGKGYTVIDQSGEIRSFDVKVTGRMGGGKMSSPRILIDISGPVIEETGGAISGMSGSPIYIDGKLVGALSASIKDMYINKGILVTPIADMVKIWDYPDYKNKTSLPQVDIKKSREDAEKEKKEFDKKVKDIKIALNEINPEHFPEVNNPNLADNLKSTWHNPNLADNLREDYQSPDESEMPADNSGDNDKNGNAAESGDQSADNSPQATDGGEQAADTTDIDSQAVDEKTVLVASGFTQRGLDFVREDLQSKGFDIKNVSEWNSFAGANTVEYDASLEPGSAVGVAAAVGDYSIGAIGTVTAVDGKRILAFGHPFSHRGNVNYFMTGSNVISTVHGPLDGMKLGSNTSLIGRINQDREAGIAGILGEFPQNVPVRVTVNDVDLAKSVTYNSMVAYDEELVPALSTAMVYDALGKTINREMGGTARINFAVRTSVAENSLVERNNMFYNAADVGKPAISELTEVMNAICNNKDREADITDIKVDVFIEGKRKTASLLSAVPSKTEVTPGEELSFKVTIKPYRSEKQVMDVPYTVSKTQLPGTLSLDIHGGGLVNVAKLLLAQQGGDEELEADKSVTTEAILKKMVDANRNNEIIIEPAVAPPMTEAQQKEAIKQAIKQAKKAEEQAKKALESGEKPEAVKPAAEPVSRYTTDYIIDNVVHSTIKVVEKKN